MQDKEDYLDSCYQWDWKLRVRLRVAFGRNPSQAKSFPSKNFQNAESSENTMMSVMEILIRIADKYKTESLQHLY